MAADQPSKRSKGNNAIGLTSREQQKAKKKKLESSRYDFKTRSNISLEWDDKKKSVIPKKEQISIAHRELSPFLASIPHHQGVLGDVFTAPPEIFDLKNLSDVMSYEVWKTHLSEQERNFLIQLLPEGTEPHGVVHELLSGNNFYFGNPFLKWGASLCSGDCHPDVVLRREECDKANKIAYCSELQNYHTKMIENLQTWKTRWASCKNSEEFMLKILRSRKDNDKRGSTRVNMLHDPEDDMGATSESSSWDADQKACCSDSPNLPTMRGGTSKRKDFENYYDSSDVLPARPRKGEKVHKRNIVCGDGAQYMSYIKVSREQHQRVMSSMKHNSNSIQPKSLNHVLGNLDTFSVQPYELFEEEERQKLHKHWLKLVKEDLPAGFGNWRKWQFSKLQLTKSLKEEIIEKVTPNDLLVLDFCDEDEEKEETEIMLIHATNNGISDDRPVDTPEDAEERSNDSLSQEHMDGEETSHEPSITPEDNEEKSADSIFQSGADNGEANYDTPMEVEQRDESSHDSAQNQYPQQVAVLDDNQNYCPMEMNSNNNVLVKSDALSNIVEYPETLSRTVDEGDPLSSAAAEIWPTVSLPSAFYHQPTSMSHGYASTGELSLGHPQGRHEQPSQIIQVEPEMHQDPHRSFLNRQSGGHESFFNQYANQDRNELLQSLFKNPASSYQQEQKQARLGLLPISGDVMLEAGNFPGNMQETVEPVDLRQKRLSDLYIHQNFQQNMYADGGGRYAIPRQENLLPVNHVPDWSLNGTIHMPSSSHPQLNGGELLGHNWFSGDHQVRDGWSGLDGAMGSNPNIGNGNHIADQSLYSVLSQCNGLRSGVNYDPMGMTERYQQLGPHGGLAGGAITNTHGVVLPRTVTAPDYLSVNEAQSGLRTNGLGWVSLPHPDAPLQETLGKSFSQSWNRLG